MFGTTHDFPLGTMVLCEDAFLCHHKIKLAFFATTETKPTNHHDFRQDSRTHHLCSQRQRSVGGPTHGTSSYRHCPLGASTKHTHRSPRQQQQHDNDNYQEDRRLSQQRANLFGQRGLVYLPQTTSGIVTLVSQILVASMILRQPFLDFKNARR